MVLAMTLVCAPPGEPIPPISADDWPALRAALRDTAIAWELLDPRESHFSHLQNLAADLNDIRRRQLELADAPLLADADRFPPRDAVETMLARNRDVRRAVLSRQALNGDHRESMRASMSDLDARYHIWNAARDARCEVYFTPVRRHALRRLREWLGEESYLAGRLPPHVTAP
jgi:hypothetical protein